VCDLLDNLNLFGHFLDSFPDLDDRHYFLNNSFDNLVPNLDMVLCFLGVSVFHYRNNLFHYLFHLYHLRNFNYLLNNCLDKYRHFDNLFYNPFNLNYLLSLDLYLLYFHLDMIDDFFDLYWPVNLYNLLFDELYLQYLGDLLLELNNLFDDGGDLNDSLNFSLVGNQSFLLCLNDHWLLNRHMNYLLHLYDFLYLNNLLDNFVNSHHFRDLNDSFHNLFDDLLDFYNLLVDPEHLQDVIYVDSIHDFGFDHANDPFIELESHSSLNFHFL
jgi:hypothetical protein